MGRLDPARERVVRLLVQRLRHRPTFLSVRQVVLILRRFVKHAVPGPAGSDCVLWGGRVNNDGYGLLNIRLHGHHCTLLVHRLAAQMAGHPREIPEYREVAHRCDTPACFSPLCVEIQRRSDNRRKSAENTRRKIARRKLAALRGELRA